MLREIKDFILGNYDPLSIPVDANREYLEKTMIALVKKVQDRAVERKKWNSTAETAAAESKLLDLFDEVVSGYATLADFSAACHRWEVLGTLGLRSFLGSKSIMSTRGRSPSVDHSGTDDPVRRIKTP